MTTEALAVILAGGESRRMGQDKAFAPLAGRPLIAHAIDRLAPQCAAIAISAGTDTERFDGLGLEVLPDARWQGGGPLVGVLAAMNWAAKKGARHVLTVPVDTPFLPADYAARLASVTAPIVLAETADGWHGACGRWSVILREDLGAALAAGTRKVTDFAASHGAQGCVFPAGDPPPFFNVNRPEDLARAEAWMTTDAKE